MSDNLKIVEYFVKGCLSDETEKLENFVSPDFKYVLNLNSYFSWEEFAARNRLLYKTTITEIHEITCEDDVHFHYDFDVSLPEPNASILIHGFVQVIVKGGLITRLDLHTDGSEDGFETFQQLRKNSSTVLL